MSTLFREMMIWKRVNEKSAVRYCCLLDLTNNTYAVQNADFFNLPIAEGAVTSSLQQFAELFMEISPTERCTWFDSVEEAISHHDQDFGNT